MIPAGVLGLLLLSASSVTVPSSLTTGWEIASGSPAVFRPAAEFPAEMSPGESVWLRAGFDLDAPDTALSLELLSATETDEVFLDGQRLVTAARFSAARIAPDRVDRLLEIPPRLAGAGHHILLVHAAPRARGEALFAGPPRLDVFVAALSRGVLRELPGTVAAVATASFGLLSLLFFLRDRTRRDLLLYALFAAGVSVDIAIGMPLGAPTAWKKEVAAALLFLLPAAGWAFLAHFLSLPFAAVRKLLLVPPVAGLVLVLTRVHMDRSVQLLGALTLLGFGADLLISLARGVRRRRPDASLLFVGTIVLLFAALVDAGMGRVVSFGSPFRLVGPAFLVFTALVLVAVADEGRRLLVRATTDPLTGLLNRAELLRRARAEVERAERNGATLAFVMLDLDHFKSVNDRYGHPAGDRVLVAAARAIAETIRGIDVSGRYGGEEFTLVLVNPTEDAILGAVERVRAAISALAPPRVPERITASAGVAIHNGLFERAEAEDLIRRADTALYESKRAGRDRTTLESSRPAAPATAAEVRYR